MWWVIKTVKENHKWEGGCQRLAKKSTLIWCTTLGTEYVINHKSNFAIFLSLFFSLLPNFRIFVWGDLTFWVIFLIKYKNNSNSEDWIQSLELLLFCTFILHFSIFSRTFAKKMVATRNNKTQTCALVIINNVKLYMPMSSYHSTKTGPILFFSPFLKLSK